MVLLDFPKKIEDSKQGKNPTEKGEDLQDILREQRATRYACQSVARMALPNERVTKCLRNVLSHGNVEVHQHLKTKKAFYGNLIVCGSVWNCPVCASKISERRRQELKQAFELHKSQGGYLAMLTLTFSHKKTDKLKEILDKFSKATSYFRSGRKFNNLREQMGLIGSVRAFEITYGSNGFHPHIHIILFYSYDVNLKVIEKEMKDLYITALNKYDLTATRNYGLTLQRGEDAEEYMTKHGKWSLDREMTKSHIKKGKGEESITPFDFLRLVIETGESKYLGLFKEYARSLKRKHQLSWSPGLKSRFIIEEKTDEEVAKEQTEEADLLGLIDYPTWKVILKHEYRSLFLDHCEKKGFESALSYILDKKKNLQSNKN